MSFSLINESPLYVFLIQTFHILIHRLLGITLRSRVKDIFLTIQHINIALVNHIAEHTKTSIPLDILPNRSLNICRKTEEIAFVFIERTRLVIFQYAHLSRIFLPFVEVLIINGLIAIETIKVAHGVWLISRVQCQSVLWNQVLAIIVHAENTIVLGSISRLCIQRVDIFRVLRTIAIVVDIGERTALESQVGIKCHRWQYTKVPTRFDFAP